MVRLSALCRVGEPFVAALDAKDVIGVRSGFPAAEKPYVLDGSRMGDRSGLMKEFARGLQFPRYFGGNWSALDDCMRDLSWLGRSAFFAIITDGEDVLSRDLTCRSAFILSLNQYGRYWADNAETPRQSWDTRPMAFHFLIAFSSVPGNWARLPICVP